MGMRFREILRKLADFSNRLRAGDKSADLMGRLMAGKNGGIF
jgi:hypothetical protein